MVVRWRVARRVLGGTSELCAMVVLDILFLRPCGIGHVGKVGGVSKRDTHRGH